MLARWLERRARCWGPPGPPPARPGPTVPRPPHRHRQQAGENLHCCWWAGPMVGGGGRPAQVTSAGRTFHWSVPPTNGRKFPKKCKT